MCHCREFTFDSFFNSRVDTLHLQSAKAELWNKRAIESVLSQTSIYCASVLVLIKRWRRKLTHFSTAAFFVLSKYFITLFCYFHTTSQPTSLRESLYLHKSSFFLYEQTLHNLLAFRKHLLIIIDGKWSTIKRKRRRILVKFLRTIPRCNIGECLGKQI